MGNFKIQSAKVLSILSVLTTLLNAPSDAQYRHNEVEEALARAIIARHQPGAHHQVNQDEDQVLVIQASRVLARTENTLKRFWHRLERACTRFARSLRSCFERSEHSLERLNERAEQWIEERF